MRSGMRRHGSDHTAGRLRPPRDGVLLSASVSVVRSTERTGADASAPLFYQNEPCQGLEEVMIRPSVALGLVVPGLTAGFTSTDPEDPPAPTVDRVGFPNNYREEFEVLRAVNRSEKGQVVTVYGNREAASITSAGQLPYPFGSIIVMETAAALKDKDGKPLLDDSGIFRRDNVVGLHVMRRQKDFGEAYGKNRTGH